MHTPVVDVSDMEVIASDHAMSQRLRSLGWSSTEKFHTYNIYFTHRRHIIGATRFLPGSATCVHYALPLSPD